MFNKEYAFIDKLIFITKFPRQRKTNEKMKKIIIG